MRENGEVERNLQSIRDIPDEVLPDGCLHKAYLAVAAAAGYDVYARREGERWTIRVDGRAYSPEEWLRTDWREVNYAMVRGTNR